VTGGKRDRARVRRDRLDEHPSPTLASPRAPGQLRDQRERALLGPEIREAERLIGVEDDAEGDVGKVVALGDHLRADENPGGRRLETLQGSSTLGQRGCVGVQTEDREAVPAKRRPELVLDALGSCSVAGK